MGIESLYLPQTTNIKLLRMKQFYTAAFAVLLTTAVTAQGLLPMANKTANQRRLEAYNTPTEVERDVIWSHDCNVDSCSSWVFDNGSAIVGSPWEDIDLNFECTLEGPAGPYNQWAGGTGDFSAASPMNSTTADNGLLLVDSDLFGADANYDAAWIENSWVQTADPIDCSSLDFVSISMETRYRCWDNGASDDSEKCLIEVSRDGVNWPSIDTFGETEGTVDYGDGELVASRWEVFPGYETADGTDNPSLVEFDITSAAGGQEQIWVRFRWSGTWGYSWEIDDIQIYQTPANDLRIDNYLSFLLQYDAGTHDSIRGKPYRQIELPPAVASKLRACRAELRGMLWGDLRKVLHAWYHKLVKANDDADADDEVLDQNTRRMCIIHSQ